MNQGGFINEGASTLRDHRTVWKRVITAECHLSFWRQQKDTAAAELREHVFNKAVGQNKNISL